MKRRWKTIIGVATVILLLAGIWMIRTHVLADEQVTAYKISLIEHGEKLEIADVLPPPVPPEQNGADIVNAFSKTIDKDEDNFDWTNLPPTMRLIAPGKAIICFTQPDVRDRYFYFTNSWSNVLAAAKANRSATDSLRQVMNYPALDFHVNYGPDYQVLETLGYGSRPSSLQTLKLGVERLSAEAICDLRLGDDASAATNICAILALVNGIHDERLLGSQYLRMFMASIAAAANWELLQSTNITDTDLALLQKKWESVEYIQALKGAFLMESAIAESQIKKSRDSHEYFNKTRGGGGGEGGPGDWDFSGSLQDDLDIVRDHMELSYGKTMWHVSWTYSDELRMLQNDRIILETVRTVETNGYFYPASANLRTQLLATVTSEGSSDLNFFRWGFSNESAFFGMNIFESIMAAEAGKRIVITAIALKRYQLKHGNYPPDLDTLVPEFLPSAPLDPVDGQPLRYRLKLDGTFLLYSVGPNGKDDGGSAVFGKNPEILYSDWLNRGVLDWVWPQPATAEEIRNFYAHPPK